MASLLEATNWAGSAGLDPLEVFWGGALDFLVIASGNQNSFQNPPHQKNLVLWTLPFRDADTLPEKIQKTNIANASLQILFVLEEAKYSNIQKYNLVEPAMGA